MINLKKSLMLLGSIAFCSCNVAFMNLQQTSGNGEIITQTYSLEDYDEIVISGSLKVALVDGKEGDIKVTIDNNLLEYVTVVSENGVLKLGSKSGFNIKPTNLIQIEVPVEEVSKLSITGSGDIISSTIIKTTAANLKVSGSGSIDIPVQSESLRAVISGSGDIITKGTTEAVTVSISGSGDFSGNQLIADNAYVHINGSGNINVEARALLKARVNGSGNVRYKGSPKSTDFKANGSGSIKSY